MSSQLLIDLRLRSEGRIEIVVLRAGMPERGPICADNPAAALELVRAQIGLTETGPVSVMLSRGRALLSSWTTSSASLALYWAADALEKAWRPPRARQNSTQPLRPTTDKLLRTAAANAVASPDEDDQEGAA